MKHNKTKYSKKKKLIKEIAHPATQLAKRDLQNGDHQSTGIQLIKTQ